MSCSKRPTHVAIYIGSNDVWHHYQFEGTTGTKADAYERGLRRLVASIRDAGSDVLLCTPSVIGEYTSNLARVNQHLAEYADITRAVAASTDTYLCDLRLAFEEFLRGANPDGAYEGILTTDGLHLSEAGNRFVADFMLLHLRAVLGGA